MVLSGAGTSVPLQCDKSTHYALGKQARGLADTTDAITSVTCLETVYSQRGQPQVTCLFHAVILFKVTHMVSIIKAVNLIQILSNPHFL